MSAFKDGYDNFIRLRGAGIGAGTGTVYVNSVEAEIEKLVNAMNEPVRKIDKTSVDYVKGFAAEWWHAGTFNIDAAVKGVKTRANAPDDNGIVDIFLTSGEEYSLKYYKSGDKSAKGQAITNLERYKKYCADYRRDHNGQDPSVSLEEYIKDKHPNDPYYLGQGRLIPTDQIKEAEQWLKKKIAKETGNRPEQVERYQEALDNLTDRLKSSDGAESIPLTEEEARELAKLAKEAGFDPAEWGLTTEDLITSKYIMNQAFKAGLSAALVSVVLNVAPEICGIICKLIKEGTVDAEQFKSLGFAALNGGAEGFVRGTVAAAITTACKAGKLGTALKTLDYNIIGTITAIAINTIKNAVLMSLGKMSKHEFANKCVEDLVITVFSIGLGAAGSAAAATMFSPAAAIFGYMIGSFVGSVIGGFVYKGAYSCVISFCIESGSTFFGLVEQDYELPREVLTEIGVDVFDYETIEPEWYENEYIEPDWLENEYIQPEKIDITFLRRGVISIGKIGYGIV